MWPPVALIDPRLSHVVPSIWSHAASDVLSKIAANDNFSRAPVFQSKIGLLKRYGNPKGSLMHIVKLNLCTYPSGQLFVRQEHNPRMFRRFLIDPCLIDNESFVLSLPSLLQFHLFKVPTKTVSNLGKDDPFLNDSDQYPKDDKENPNRNRNCKQYGLPVSHENNSFNSVFKSIWSGQNTVP